MASASPYSPITVPALDYSKENMPSAKTFHGLNICINDNVIGRIQTWGPGARTRTVTPKWELSKDNFGRPVELVPSKSEGYTISLSRLEIWDNEIEIALGYSGTDMWIDLIDQNYPITLSEKLYKGQDLKRHWSYPACWFTSYSEEQITSEGDGYYQVTAEIAHLPRTRLQ